MSRFDAVGLFWEDIDNKTLKMQAYLNENGWAPLGATKWYKASWETRGEPFKEMALLLPQAYQLARQQPKREPPERTWDVPGFIPSLELLDEATAFPVDLFTDEELIEASVNNEILIFDIECYKNYFLIAFKGVHTDKVIYFELENDSQPMDLEKLNWVMHNFCVVGFYSRNYDIPMTSVALAGKNNIQLKIATDLLIVDGVWGHHVIKKAKAKKLENIDHIDIIEVAPLSASLKIYGGRIHTQKMQDLPFAPQTILTPDQASIVRWYCINDLNTTKDLFNKLKPQLDIRRSLSTEKGIDLRSKSDAQIAEAVISDEVALLNGCRVKRPTIEPGTPYKYHVPCYIEYKSDLMNYILDIIRDTYFIVAENGSIGMPEELKGLTVDLAGGSYRMGIGGLHSSEENISHHSDEDTVLISPDVISYYPAIILNLGLFPTHMGSTFLNVYRGIVDRRLIAKANKNKEVADTLKIVVNGSFGKLGSKYSSLYAPDLLIQVTLTGQLALLMLIERIEWVGIPVVSANTDGIVIKCPRGREEELKIIVTQWEKDTKFVTEETRFASLYSRDVNNYLAILEEPDLKTGKIKIKGKGAYSTPGLQKNPTSLICVTAVKAFLTSNTTIEGMIRDCKDITQFLTVRTVKGGAVRNGEYLGKAIRWYYSTSLTDEDEIIYASSGNKVPKSEGAMPLMELPDQLPDDINYQRYINDAYSMLDDIGY